jgi:hypothetical protein
VKIIAALLAGAGIAITTWVAASLYPERALSIGWTGACAYFWVIEGIRK